MQPGDVVRCPDGQRGKISRFIRKTKRWRIRLFDGSVVKYTTEELASSAETQSWVLQPGAKIPKGFSFFYLNNESARTGALIQIQHIVNTNPLVTNMISSNLHFFIGLPYPLEFLTGPVYALDDPAVQSIVSYVREAMLGLVGSERTAKMLKNPRLNMIVRNYTKKQNIRFHVDKLYFEEPVFGIVLENTHEQGRGLEFKKNAGALQASLTLKEFPGFSFLMEAAARYKWNHGFNARFGCRTSVTVRFYREEKDGEIQDWDESTIEAELLEQVTKKRGKIRIILRAENQQDKVTVLHSMTSYQKFRRMVRNKLRMKEMRMFFYSTETEITEVNWQSLFSFDEEEVVIRVKK